MHRAAHKIRPGALFADRGKARCSGAGIRKSRRLRRDGKEIKVELSITRVEDGRDGVVFNSTDSCAISHRQDRGGRNRIRQAEKMEGRRSAHPAALRMIFNNILTVYHWNNHPKSWPTAVAKRKPQTCRYYEDDRRRPRQRRRGSYPASSCVRPASKPLQRGRRTSIALIVETGNCCGPRLGRADRDRKRCLKTKGVFATVDPQFSSWTTRNPSILALNARRRGHA